MRRNYYTIRNLIGHRTLLEKYNLTEKELFSLIAASKLNPILQNTTIFFNADKVADYFDSQNNQDKPSVTINSREIIAKWNLDRTEFARLLQEKKIVPLPLTHTANLHFEFNAVCEFFDNIFGADDFKFNTNDKHDYDNKNKT